MARGFAALSIAAVLLAGLAAGALNAGEAVEKARGYSRVMASLQQLKAIEKDVSNTFVQVIQSAEGATAREKAFDAARKLVLAEAHLEEKYAANRLDLGFGECGDWPPNDFSVEGESWSGERVPLSASILYLEEKGFLSAKGRAFVKGAPLIASPCFKGFARAGSAEYRFDLNEFG